MAAAMKDAELNSRRKKVRRDMEDGRRPFDMTDEEKRQRNGEPTPAAEPEGGFEEPPTPEEMESEMRSVLNREESGQETPRMPGDAEVTPDQYEKPAGPMTEEEQAEADRQAVLNDPNASAVDRARARFPAQERSAASEARGRKLKKQKIITSWMRRTGMTRSEVTDLWDQGVENAAEGEDEFSAGVNGIVTSPERHNAEYQKEEQIRQNVKNQASQVNRARVQGISRGLVMAIDDVVNAGTPEQMLKAMITGAAVYPQFRPLAQAVISGQVSAQAIQAQLAQTQIQSMSTLEAKKYEADAAARSAEAKSRAEDPVGTAQDRAKNAEFTPQGVNDVILSASQLAPGDEPRYIANTFAGQMQSMAQGILSGQPASPEDLSAMKSVLMAITGGGMPTARDMQMAFGGNLSPGDLKELAGTLFGQQGVRNMTVTGNARGAIKDVLGIDPGEWAGWDASDV